MPSPFGAAVGLLRQADSLATTAGAIASDWVSFVRRSDRLDPFEYRDPEHIRRPLPGMKAYGEIYHRSGRRALEYDVPIVPVVAIGGQETALFLGQGRRLSKALQLDKTMRLKVLPPVLGPPFGATILDLPLRVPLPAKITVAVSKPIDL